MTILHFLKVGQGDCSIIQHSTRRVSVIDTCKARHETRRAVTLATSLLDPFVRDERGEVPLQFGGLGSVRPNNATDHTNPIEYLKKIGVEHVHRFILTHPDMDHMDGIKDLLGVFPPSNFWDTANVKSFKKSHVYRDEDWQMYLALRDGQMSNGPKRLVLYDGDEGAFWNRNGSRGEPHDDLLILAPTPELIDAANSAGDWNDASYVLLQFTPAGRILFWGDAHDRTREHVLSRYAAVIKGVEIMIAPHHGRDSGGNREYLDIIRPKLTLFGCAPSEHLAYDAWYNRDLDFITNTQAGNIIVDSNNGAFAIHVENEAFARKRNVQTSFDSTLGAWHLGYIS